jgi:cytochrome c-type biogenesis protein CcmH
VTVPPDALAATGRSRYIGAMTGGTILFWAIAAAMALAVAALMARALLRAPRGAGAEVQADNPDLRVYRDQLAEIDRDRSRGVLSPADAETARAEIARRLLDADRRARGARAAPTGAAPTRRPAAAALMVAGVVAATGAIYWQIGAPGYPDLPLTARLAAADAMRATRPDQAEAERQVAAARPAAPAPDAQLADLMTQLRAALADRPDDLQGHIILARNEANLGNFAAAARAQARVVALRGDAATATDHADLAELLILAAGGYVSPEAEAALDAALSRDPQNGPARYYLGLMHAQTGRPDRAFALWDALLRESRPGAPWVPSLRAQLPEAAAQAGVRYDLPADPAPPAAGPTPEDIAAAQGMDPAARGDMIRGMVEGLAQRLAREGGTPDDWGRLISSLVVLGEDDRARAILAEARTAFADAPGAVDTIDAAARAAGLTE